MIQLRGNARDGSPAWLWWESSQLCSSPEGQAGLSSGEEKWARVHQQGFLGLLATQMVLLLNLVVFSALAAARARSVQGSTKSKIQEPQRGKRHGIMESWTIQVGKDLQGH